MIHPHVFRPGVNPGNAVAAAADRRHIHKLRPFGIPDVIQFPDCVNIRFIKTEIGIYCYILQGICVIILVHTVGHDSGHGRNTDKKSHAEGDDRRQ